MKFILFFGLVVQTATLLNAERDEILHSRCVSPPLDKSITTEWVNEVNPSGGWYFPMVSKSNTKASSPQNELTHKIIPQRNTGEEFCPRMTWADGIGEFSYYGKTRLIFKCTTMNGTFAFQQCKVIDTDNEEGEPKRVNIYMTDSDNQSYTFLLRCWENGVQDWTITSTNGKVNEDLKNRVLDHAYSLGFDRDAYHMISYDKCSG